MTIPAIPRAISRTTFPIDVLLEATLPGASVPGRSVEGNAPCGEPATVGAGPRQRVALLSQSG